MPSKRVPSPRETIKIRRHKVGQKVLIEAEIVRVADAEGGHQGRITYRLPGAPVPVTVDARYVPDTDA